MADTAIQTTIFYQQMITRPKLLFLALFLIVAVGLVGWFWQSPISSENLTAAAISSDEIIKLEISTAGLYRLYPERLQEKGLDIANWDPNRLGLTSMGRPIPFYIDGQSIVFYGEGSNSIYANFRPYLLHLTASTAQRQLVEQRPAAGDVAPTAGTITKQRLLEKNLVYNSVAYDQAFPDTWYWETIHVQKKFEFSQPFSDVADGSGHMTIHFFGQSHDPTVDGDHDIDLIINGQKVTTIIWEGPVHYVAEVDLPPGTLVNGENQFVFDNTPPGGAFIDIMGLDNINLTYSAQPTALDDQIYYQSSGAAVAINGFTGPPLVFDISNRAAPVLLTDTTFEGGSLLISEEPAATLSALGPAAPLLPFEASILQQKPFGPATEGELVIIAAPELAPSLEAYIDHREGQGLTVMTVNPQAIYDQFGYGLPSPEAIQSFLTHARDSWASVPRYVLLVGPARYDSRDFLGLLPDNAIPSMMVPVTHSGETVSDNRIADLDGDFQPDVAIGRWPVGTPEGVADLAERTMAYENGAAANQVLFAADGTSQEFTGLSDHLLNAAALPNPQRLHGATAQEVATSWNEGTWLISYVGHGSIRLWGKDNLFGDESVALLTENETYSPPIVAQFTCLTGYYAHPTERSLSELLLLKSGGPVLVLGATSLTYSTHQRPFAERFLQGVNDPEFTRIGDVLLFARDALDYNNEGIREVSDTFGLLGDPSAIIVRPSG